MKNFIAAFFLTLVYLNSYSQETLPNFNVRILSNEHVSISWRNPFSSCNQIAVQRSYDSLKFFKTIFSPQSPELPQNGFVDNTPAPGMKVYYRIFYVLSGGSYFFTKSKQPGVGNIEETIEPKYQFNIKKSPKQDVNNENQIIKFENLSMMYKSPRILNTDETEEDTIYVHWVNIYRKSKDSLISSALICSARTFVKFSEPATSLTTFIFFKLESHKKKETSGKYIARGTPGNPPPVPTSSTLAPLGNFMNFAIAKE